VRRYLEIADDLQHRIDDGEWSPGDRLPGAAVLAAHYQAGKPIIAEAIGVLEVCGRVRPHPRSGTYVLPPAGSHQPVNLGNQVRRNDLGYVFARPFGHWPPVAPPTQPRRACRRGQHRAPERRPVRRTHRHPPRRHRRLAGHPRHHTQHPALKHSTVRSASTASGAINTPPHDIPNPRHNARKRRQNSRAFDLAAAQGVAKIRAHPPSGFASPTRSMFRDVPSAVTPRLPPGSSANS